ncbi:SirB2 family protein [Pseudohalioglobus lutimaris]|uniref:SirB2 family protein n=1 Tax=Pseudohalioglobus lutimaris TaxID=1737061 RepID=UPI0013FD585A|nr:SirB2 family protein [Pseudohalioglobus lutimaris]
MPRSRALSQNRHQGRLPPENSWSPVCTVGFDPVGPDKLLLMMTFTVLKTAHVLCAFLSVAGFALRGYWALQSNPLCKHRLVKVLPHVIDSCLLGTAVGMLWIWGVSPLSLPWVTAKLVALLLYIALGMAALRFARTREARLAAYLAALATAAYIVAVALTHSAWGPLG